MRDKELCDLYLRLIELTRLPETEELVMERDSILFELRDRPPQLEQVAA